VDQPRCEPTHAGDTRAGTKEDSGKLPFDSGGVASIRFQRRTHQALGKKANMKFTGFGKILVALALCLACSGVARAKPPSWDTIKHGASRFKVLSAFNNEAVLDKETGLVWQRQPYSDGSIPLAGYQAIIWCASNVSSGNRFGWRLPSVEELSTLIDPTVVGSPKLPAGHPFTCSGGGCSLGGLSGRFWTATVYIPGDYTERYFVDFLAGSAFNDSDSNPHGTWCVRAGSGAGLQ
jgi:hypothetical protein